jgi:hypothetical protein
MNPKTRQQTEKRQAAARIRMAGQIQQRGANLRIVPESLRAVLFDRPDHFVLGHGAIEAGNAPSRCKGNSGYWQAVRIAV